MSTTWIAILSFLGSSTGYAILSFIVRVIKKRKEDKEKIEEERLSELIIEKMKNEVLSEFVYKDELTEADARIINKFNAETNAINNKLDKIIRKQDKSEVSRIATDILGAADDLKNNKKVSIARYQYLLESFSYYKDTLHKNGYVEQQMNYIKEYMEKKDREIKFEKQSFNKNGGENDE